MVTGCPARFTRGDVRRRHERDMHAMPAAPSAALPRGSVLTLSVPDVSTKARVLGRDPVRTLSVPDV